MPFSRYFHVNRPWGEVVEERPIRVLVAISNPDDVFDRVDLPPVDVAAERDILESAFSALDADELDVTFVDAPVTLAKLEDALRDGYHILHFVGHGAFSARRRRAIA